MGSHHSSGASADVFFPRYITVIDAALMEEKRSIGHPEEDEISFGLLNFGNIMSFVRN